MTKPKQPESFTEVLDLWPTPTAAVSDIGCTLSQFFKWRRRDRIPQEWFSAVVATDVARSRRVDAELMLRLAARELAEARP